MSSEIDKFSVELVKIAAQDSKKQNYASAVLAAAPFAAAKAAVDVPKGMIDKAVDSAIRTGKPKLKGIAARGIGRGLGSLGPGMITTPLFLSGIKQLSTAKTKSEKREGTAKILGAGFAFAALKGATEAAVEKGVSNVKPKDAFKIVRNIAGVRGATGLASAGLVAKQLAESRKSGKKDSTKSDFTAGLAIGAGKGAVDELAEKGLKSFKSPKGLRGLAARAGGRAAAGAIGAVALGKIVDSYMKKTASELPPGILTAASHPALTQHQPGKKPTPTLTPGAVYDQMIRQARTMPSSSVYSAYAAHVARGNPELNPTRRAVHYALTDSLQERGHSVPEPQMREKVAPKQTGAALPTAAMIGALLAPEAAMRYMDSLSTSEKDRLLSESLDEQILARNIDYFKEAPDDIWAKGLYEKLDSTKDGFTAVNPDTGRVAIMVGEEASAAVKAHELGHAAANPLRKAMLQNSTVRRAAELGRLGTVVIPMGALFMASDSSFATPRELESKKKFVETAGRIGTMAMMPKIIEEALASVSAVEYLRKAEIASGTPASKALPNAIKRSLKKLGPAFLTYASPVILPGIAARYLSSKADQAEKNLYRKVHGG